MRPTTAKILESMMAVLEPRCEGVRALDLFAGTGQVGLSLLDQGAAEVVFVEADRRVAQDLRRLFRSKEGCQLLVGRIPQVLSKLEGQYGLILVDPPYDWDQPESLLPATATLALPGATLVVEHHHKTPYEASSEWELERQQKFGETRLSYFLKL